VYATRDTLDLVLHDRPSGISLDFFAGSGTTLHAVALLNAQDGGNRQCILVTNNDVSDTEAKRLVNDGHFPGDSDYEKRGIFESVTKPRIVAALSGQRADGTTVHGDYPWQGRRPIAEGFEENVAFFRMEYLEPDYVDLNRQYNAIAPLLWMTAGSIGSWEEWDGKSAWSAPANSSYAVLFDTAEAPAFGAYVEGRPEVTHTWIVTDSHSAYVELRSELPAGVAVGQLYRDYLRNFRVNGRGALD
jgi:adenine-specific DNA-methyltransferase